MFQPSMLSALPRALCTAATMALIPMLKHKMLFNTCLPVKSHPWSAGMVPAAVVVV